MNRGRLHPLDIRQRPPYAAADRDPCIEPGCITVPNGYNPGPRCLIHTPAEEPDERAHSHDLEIEAKRHARMVPA